MNEADERDWQQGFNRCATSTTMSPLNMDPDCWDDAAILDIFDDAIRSHRTKVVVCFVCSFCLFVLFCLLLQNILPTRTITLTTPLSVVATHSPITFLF